jgi:phosphoribosylformylglycinamidine synthase
MLAKVYVTLKPGVLDPQGKAVQHALETLGFKGVQDVRVGKYIELNLSGLPKSDAEARVKQMCEGLLANMVIEKYRIEWDA